MFNPTEDQEKPRDTPQDNDEHGIRPPVILIEKYGPPLYQSLGTWESQVWLKNEWMNVNMNVKSAQCLKHYLTNKHDFI